MADKKDPTPDDGKFTQEQVNSMLAEQKRKLEGKYADYDELKGKAEQLDKKAADEDSALEKLNKQVEDLTKKSEEAEARALRAEVATAKGLTPGQAKRLAGSTREELEADADEILEDFPVQSNDEPARRGGPPSRQPKPELRGGGDPTTEEPVETDPSKLAESVPRY